MPYDADNFTTTVQGTQFDFFSLAAHSHLQSGKWTGCQVLLGEEAARLLDVLVEEGD